MLIAVGCLWFSHYVLELTSPLADNIAANVVGVGLGTIFRYFCYKYLVFTGAPTQLVELAHEHDESGRSEHADGGDDRRPPA